MTVETRERRMWQGGLVTILKEYRKSGRKVCDIRDEFGFTHEAVPAKELEELRDDDPQKFYSFGEPD